MFANPRDETAHPLQLDLPSRTPAKVMKRDDERIVVLVETSSRVELCLEKCPSFAYNEVDRPASRDKEVGSKKKKLSLSIMSIEKEKRKVARSIEGRNEGGVRRI